MRDNTSKIDFFEEILIVIFFDRVAFPHLLKNNRDKSRSIQSKAVEIEIRCFLFRFFFKFNVCQPRVIFVFSLSFSFFLFFLKGDEILFVLKILHPRLPRSERMIILFLFLLFLMNRQEKKKCNYIMQKLQSQAKCLITLISLLAS